MTIVCTSISGAAAREEAHLVHIHVDSSSYALPGTQSPYQKIIIQILDNQNAWITKSISLSSGTIYATRIRVNGYFSKQDLYAMRILPQLTILMILVSASLTSLGQNNGDLVLWGTKELTWSDFKGRVPGGTRYDALTNSQIRVTNKWDQDSLHLEVTTKFVRSKSWAKKTRTAELLKHEKLHLIRFYRRLTQETHQKLKTTETYSFLKLN